MNRIEYKLISLLTFTLAAAILVEPAIGQGDVRYSPVTTIPLANRLQSADESIEAMLKNVPLYMQISALEYRHVVDAQIDPLLWTAVAELWIANGIENISPDVIDFDAIKAECAKADEASLEGLVVAGEGAIQEFFADRSIDGFSKGHYMQRIFIVWCPYGKSESDLVAVFGPPSSHLGNRAKYRFLTDRIYYDFEFVFDESDQVKRLIIDRALR